MVIHKYIQKHYFYCFFKRLNQKTKRKTRIFGDSFSFSPPKINQILFKDIFNTFKITEILTSNQFYPKKGKVINPRFKKTK